MEFSKQPRDDISSSRAVLKYALLAATVFITGILQVSFFTKVRLFSATPDLLMALVLGLAVFDGERTGAVMGVWAGVLSDALGGSGLMISPLFYMLVGYIGGIVVKTWFGKNLPSWVVICFCACMTRSALTLICIAAASASFNFITAFSEVILPEFAGSYIFALPFYFLVRLLCRPFHRSTEMS